MCSQPEEDDDRLFKYVCRGNSHFKCRIIECTLRSAHPVRNASTSWINGGFTTHHDAWIGGELVERGHAFAFSDRENSEAKLATLRCQRYDHSRAGRVPSRPITMGYA